MKTRKLEVEKKIVKLKMNKFGQDAGSIHA